MKPEFENIPLVKTPQRFEIEINGHYAFIDYKEMSSKIALIHTEAEPELAGTGAAAAVVEKTLDFIEKSGKKLLPYCPYILAFIKKNREWKRIVDEKFDGYEKL